ncbi:MAG: hypothetical protein V4598_02860 [Bdellovibrionota bacterium]
MNTLSKLSFLTLALTLGACNEKVSPELQGAASSTTTGGGSAIVPPDSYYFRIANASDSMLNFKLHKSGSGNANANCEITNTFGLSSDAYRASPSTYDISCFMEADELAMHYNGFGFDIEASSNTCEYVGYAPFSFYDYMPGSSSGSYEMLECEGFATTPFIQGFAAYAGKTCDTYTSSLAGAVSFPSLGFDEADLCRFDYSEDEGPNCDVGDVSVIKRTLNRLPGPDNAIGTVDDVLNVVTTPTIKKCGGKITNCIQGPIKNEPTLSKSTSGIVVTKTAANTALKLNKDYTPLIGAYNSNRRYVNFRRDIASFDIEYGNSAKPLSSAYSSSFGDPIYNKSYNPELMMNYANNKRMDGTTLIPSGSVPVLENSMYNASPYAAEPYLGLNGSKTNPFYMAYCLDSAFDVKARIKLVVRDWDRILPTSATSTYFERISDVDLLPPFARQDVPYTDEVTGDPDSWNAFNDIADWDDTISMERDDSGMPYDPSVTVWRPLPTASYLDGFFNPGWFPVDTLTEQ